MNVSAIFAKFAALIYYIFFERILYIFSIVLIIRRRCKIIAPDFVLSIS